MRSTTMDDATETAAAPLMEQVLYEVKKIVVGQDTRLCAVGIDHAGQRSVPIEVRLQP